MNQKSFTKFCVFVLTIFIGKIAYILINDYLIIHPGHKDVYTLTAIHMGIILVIYYPLFTFVNVIAEDLSKYFIKKTKKTTGSGILSLLITFIIGLAICFAIFLKLWYHVNIFEVLWHQL